jgi:hypothetical protein
MKTLLLKICLALALAGLFPATSIPLTAQVVLPSLIIRKVPLPGGGFQIVFTLVDFVPASLVFGTYPIHSFHISLPPGATAFQPPILVPKSTPAWNPLPGYNTLGINPENTQFGLTAATDIAPGSSGQFVLQYDVDPGKDFRIDITTFRFDEPEHPDVYLKFSEVIFETTDPLGAVISTDPFGLPVRDGDNPLPVPEPATYGALAAVLLGAAAGARRIRAVRAARKNSEALALPVGS